jgi:glutamate/aspartate transport system substrate-binding protein
MMRLKLILTATALCVTGHAAIAQELTGTLEKIRSTGVITIGHRESSIPFSYYDKNEKVVGYGMDLCYLVADAVKASLGLAKLEVKLVPITPSLRIPSILSGKIDLACETMTNNLERQKVVAFSSTYFVAANRFVSKATANLRTLDDLKGRTVVSTIGSTNLRQNQRAQCATQSWPHHRRGQGQFRGVPHAGIRSRRRTLHG